MRPYRSRHLVAITITTLTLATAMGSGVVAQDAATDPVCALLTLDEVSAALGSAVEAEGTTDDWVSTCTWSPTDLDSYAYLYAEWAAGTADGIRTDFPEMTELEVGGHPAFYDLGQLFIALDAGVLRFDGAPVEGDVQSMLTELGQLALTHAASLPTPVAIEGPDVAAVGQYPIGDAFCALFTPDEVGSVVGTAFDAVPDETGCTWSATVDQVSTMSARWTETTLADHKSAWPDGEDITVGGNVAYYSPGLFLNELLIEADTGVLYLVISGYGGDVKAAVTKLGELAVSRGGSLPPPPEPAPLLDVHADATLESMLPESVGGEPMNVSSMAADPTVAQLDPGTSDAFQGILDAQGKTIDDVSIAFGVTASGTSILGIRVAGGDARALAPLLFGSMFGAESLDATPGQVAGKDVQVLTLGTDTAYYYVAGDTAWFVDAKEPQLTELFEALP